MVREGKSFGGAGAAILTMFALFFMIAFVTNFAGSMGVIVKNQFGASNTASQLGSAANFAAYFFMGIPGGLILRRRGYRFTALLAAAVGFAGLLVQLVSGYVESFAVYVTGASVAGFSMCLLNLVVNPLLNTLGGGGNRGNQLVQFGCSLNSVGATVAPALLGCLIGGEVAKARVADAAPALMIALGIFAAAFAVVFLSRIPEPHKETAEERAARLAGGVSVWRDVLATLRFRHFAFGALAILLYVAIETGIPNMANLYMTAENTSASVGAVVAGAVVALYWLGMLVGRLAGAALGSRVSSRTMVSACAAVAIACMLAIILSPERLVTVCGKTVPASMCLLPVCGLCTSVMWGGLFNLSTEGLGKYVPMGAGIYMTMVVGGLLLPVQGMIADRVGILGSYWLTAAMFVYVLVYALVLSRPKEGNAQEH